MTQGPILLLEVSSISHLFWGGGLRRSSQSSSSSLTPSQPGMQRGDPRLLVRAQELNESKRLLVIPIKTGSKKGNAHQAK